MDFKAKDTTTFLNRKLVRGQEDAAENNEGSKELSRTPVIEINQFFKKNTLLKELLALLSNVILLRKNIKEIKLQGQF